MAASSYDASLALVLKHEGGYVDHPKDPGGATNLGVTIGTLSDWLGRKATKAEVKALTKAAVGPIYRKNYWDRVRADELPAGVDYCVFDFGVNSGPKRAIIGLQRALGIADDGKVGPLTIRATDTADPKVLIERICSARLTFLQSLSTWPTFGKGWRSRVEGVRTQALKMVAGSKPATPEVCPTCKRALAA